uniref:Uncharacterized protein n=1 Tax=Caenorhabditis japonica TaxID=281687 RepID=A0A8R1HQP9_CAEJA
MCFVFLFVIPSILCLCYIYLFMPETLGRTTLDIIQEMIDRGLRDTDHCHLEPDSPPLQTVRQRIYSSNSDGHLRVY